MKPIKFKQSNFIYGVDQPQYIPLPAHRAGDKEGAVTSCWSLSFWERMKVLFTGTIYLTLWTFNQPIQPQKLHLEFEQDESSSN